MPVPGLAGIHQVGAVRLNDLSLWPRYRLLSIPGFKGLPDTEDARDLPAGQSREIPRRTQRRGKTFTYQGTIEARSQPELDAGIDALIAACVSTDELRFDVTPILPPLPADPYTVGPLVTVPPTYFRARVLALDPNEAHPDGPVGQLATRGYERPFALGVRMSDARFIEAASQTFASSGLASATGSVLPWVLPVAIVAPGFASGSLSVPVGGSAPADPVVTLTGPATNPGIRSDTLNLELRMFMALDAGAFLTIDFEARTILLGGTEDVSYLIDRARTNWWDGDAPGLREAVTNALRYVADSLTDPAAATITFNNAYWS